jgi:hypothetical protein
MVSIVSERQILIKHSKSSLLTDQRNFLADQPHQTNSRNTSVTLIMSFMKTHQI